ncbi:hypothetical protein Tco_0769688, partial [Tanacetum coccineum]
TPKKVRKVKKVASPSRKLSPVLEEEPADKPKRAKKPPKKSTTMLTAGVAIRDTPSESVTKKKIPAKVDRGKGMNLLSYVALLEAAQLKKTLKKNKLETHKLHASGSDDGVGSLLKVPDEQEDKTTITYEGTVITEYLVNINKRRAFWSLNEDILKINDSDYQYADILIRASRLKKVMAGKEKKSSMETFTPNDKANYYSRITSITVNGKNAYELKGKFLDDLHNNAFSGTNGKDAVEHIEFYLKINDPIKLPNGDHDKLRIVVFPILLAGGARRWFDKTKESITCWVDLTAKFFRKYYPPSRIEGNNTPDYRKMGGDEIEVSDDESFDLEEYWSDKEGTAEIFKIETNVFDYETPLYLAFNEFNYLLKVDPDLLTKDIMGELKDEALRNKAIMEGLISDEESSNDCWKRWKSHESYYHNYDEGEYENETHEEGHELCSIKTREVPVCQIKRYKMIKYSFKDEEEYVAVKEDEYDDLTITSEEACRAYKEIFWMMDEGLMVT